MALSDDILHALMDGDLARLSDVQRLAYYKHECERMGLDPASRPLQWIELQKRLVLYARRECGDMLAAKHRLTVKVLKLPTVVDVGSVKTIQCHVSVTCPNGRSVEDIGAVAANDPVNGPMKCVTKATRRATLRWCGFGGPDESELESIPGARAVEAPIAAPVVASKMSPIQRVLDDLSQVDADLDLYTAATIYLDNESHIAMDARPDAMDACERSMRIKPTRAAMKAAVWAMENEATHAYSILTAEKEYDLHVFGGHAKRMEANAPGRAEAGSIYLHRCKELGATPIGRVPAPAPAQADDIEREAIQAEGA